MDVLADIQWPSSVAGEKIHSNAINLKFSAQLICPVLIYLPLFSPGHGHDFCHYQSRPVLIFISFLVVYHSQVKVVFYWTSTQETWVSLITGGSTLKFCKWYTVSVVRLLDWTFQLIQICLFLCLFSGIVPHSWQMTHKNTLVLFWGPTLTQSIWVPLTVPDAKAKSAKVWN